MFYYQNTYKAIEKIIDPNDFDEDATGWLNETKSNSVNINYNQSDFWYINSADNDIKITLEFSDFSDLDLYLYDPNGYIVMVSNEVTFASTVESIIYNASGLPGKYVIEVYMYTGIFEDYTLDVEWYGIGMIEE